jgi:hypothetical protein
MSTRTSSAALTLLLLLAGCQVREEGERQAGAADDDAIECALDGAARFERVCAVERAELDGGRALTVRHPDGGFRRFNVLTDGHGLAAADGADEAKTTIEGDTLVVTVDNDRYRFPVTLKRDDPAR